MRKSMKMMLATRGRENGGEMEARARQVESGGDRFSMRYERTNGAGQMRGGENGYGRIHDGGDGAGREMRYAGNMPYTGSDGSAEEMGFRDRQGRRHYDNGRYAPENRRAGTHYDDGGREHMTRAMGYDTMPADTCPKQERENPMTNQIGFHMGEDGPAGEPLTFPGQHMIHQGKSRRLDKETAGEWVQGMKNEDGTKGAHWTMEQTEQVRRQKNLECDPVEFWVAMNAAYSDLSKVAKKYNTNSVDYYVDFVKAFWFKDQDAVPHKLAAYYDAIVRK